MMICLTESDRRGEASSSSNHRKNVDLTLVCPTRDQSAKRHTLWSSIFNWWWLDLAKFHDLEECTWVHDAHMPK